MPRVSTDEQVLTAQRDGLAALGVSVERTYVDQGLTGTSLGGAVHDPTDAVGRLLFNVLAMVAKFEGDLIRLRTREGMRVAKAKGRLRGKQPKLNVRQEALLVTLHRAGEHSIAELGDLSESPAPRSTGPSSATRYVNAPACPAVRHWEALCRRGSACGTWSPVGMWSAESETNAPVVVPPGGFRSPFLLGDPVVVRIADGLMQGP